MSSSTAPTTGRDTSSTADTVVTYREDSKSNGLENSTAQDPGADSALTDVGQHLQAPAGTTIAGFIPTCEAPNDCKVWGFYDGGKVPDGALWNTKDEKFKYSACRRPFEPGFVKK